MSHLLLMAPRSACNDASKLGCSLIAAVRSSTPKLYLPSLAWARPIMLGACAGNTRARMRVRHLDMLHAHMPATLRTSRLAKPWPTRPHRPGTVGPSTCGTVQTSRPGIRPQSTVWWIFSNRLTPSPPSRPTRVRMLHVVRLFSKKYTYELSRMD